MQMHQCHHGDKPASPPPAKVRNWSPELAGATCPGVTQLQGWEEQVSPPLASSLAVGDPASPASFPGSSAPAGDEAWAGPPCLGLMIRTQAPPLRVPMASERLLRFPASPSGISAPLSGWDGETKQQNAAPQEWGREAPGAGGVSGCGRGMKGARGWSASFIPHSTPSLSTATAAVRAGCSGVWDSHPQVMLWPEVCGEGDGWVCYPPPLLRGSFWGPGCATVGVAVGGRWCPPHAREVDRCAWPSVRGRRGPRRRHPRTQ